MLKTPFFDPYKSYEENWNEGPFGEFADGVIFRDLGEPTYEIFGHKVYLPFGIPAGPLLNGKFVQAALDKGFDIPMHKTVRTRVHPSHPWPNVVSIEVKGDLTLAQAAAPLTMAEDFTPPIAITNSFGNPSFAHEIWQKDIGEAVTHAKKGQVVAASFEGTRWDGYSDSDYVEDWVLGAKLLKETGAHILEANLSCPNEGSARLLCYDIPRVRQIAEAIKNEVGDTPLLLKTAYFPEQTELEELVRAVGGIADGFASINTISAEVVKKDGTQALPGGPARKKSGVCGAPIKWAGLDMVKRLDNIRAQGEQKFLIVGVGGVVTPQDYQEYRQAGADVVMSATGSMWNPHLAIDLKKVFYEYK